MNNPDPSGVLRVLIVEDNRDTADTTAMLLRMHGYDVAVAYDGRTALQTAKGYDPDVILLDLSLPDIDGYAVAAGLRRSGVDRASLIAVSGYAPEADWGGAQFNEHLLKPVMNDALVDLLSRVRVAPSSTG
jgi:two-component system OmpR family response regulator